MLLFTFVDEEAELIWGDVNNKQQEKLKKYRQDIIEVIQPSSENLEKLLNILHQKSK